MFLSTPGIQLSRIRDKNVFNVFVQLLLIGVDYCVKDRSPNLFTTRLLDDGQRGGRLLLAPRVDLTVCFGGVYSRANHRPFGAGDKRSFYCLVDHLSKGGFRHAPHAPSCSSRSRTGTQSRPLYPRSARMGASRQFAVRVLPHQWTPCARRSHTPGRHPASTPG